MGDTRKKILIVALCIIGLAAVIGLGPILTTSIMKQVTSPKGLAAKTEESTIKKQLPQGLQLMVTGRIAIVTTDKSSLIILTSSEGKSYMLIGPKAEELKAYPGKKFTVIGKTHLPEVKEIQGQTIRFTIEVTKIIAQG